MISVRYNPMRVINSTGIVMMIPVLKYVPECLTSFCVKTCNHSNVAREPIGVIFGPNQNR